MGKMMALGLILTAKDMLSPTIGKAMGHIDKYDSKIKALGKSMTKLGTVSLGAGLAIGSAISSSYDEFQELKKAQGEIESLGIGDRGIGAITKQAREFSNEFSGTTTPQFVKASYDIKSGISSLSDVGVGKFTALAALTAKATKSTTDQMTSFFAAGYGIYSKQFDDLSRRTIAGWDALSQEEKDIKFGETFSAGIGAAVKMFKTDGTKMQNAIEALGATATTSNVPFAEQLAILGGMQKSFASGSEAATAYKGFLNGAAKAQEKLNMKFVDANNQLLSAPEILEKLRTKYGTVLDDMEKKEIKEAFGTDEGMKFITAFYGEIDELKSSIDGMGGAVQKGTSEVEKMAKAMNKGNEMELLTQRINNLTTIVGSGFAPIINKIGDVIGDTALSVGKWMKEHEELTSVITIGIAVVGGLATALGVVGISAGVFTMALPFLAKNLLVVGGAFKFVARSVIWLGRAMLMNPIGLAVTAIAGGAYLIYNNWEKVKGFFTGLWTDVKVIFLDTMNYFTQLIDDPVGTLKKSWNSITGFFIGLWNKQMTMVDTVWTYLGNLMISPIDTVKASWQSILNWFGKKFNWLGKAFDKVKGWAGSTMEWLGIGDGAGGTPGKSVIDAQPKGDSVIVKGVGAVKLPKPKLTTTPLPKPEKSAATSTSASSKKTKGGGGSGKKYSVENVNVTVNNPSSNVQVEKAVTKAIRMCSSRSLSDDA